MHASSELTLTSTYRPCNQITGLLRGHLVAALTLLGADKPSGSRIHAARKELKRARATLRLLRESIDPEHYRQEDALLRQAARHLSEVRDSDILVRTLARLQESLNSTTPRPKLEALRRLLLQERRSATSIALRQHLTAVRTLLTQSKERTRDWKVANDLDLLTRAMRRTYRKGRACYRAVCEAPADEQLHAWRRQVKCSAYQVEALGSSAPARMTKRLRRCTKLAEVLGRDHDLALLRKRMLDADLEIASALQLTHAINHERTKLRREALKLGEWLYRNKPRKYRN
jgi:CHAD domain-containing protein